MYPVAAQPKTIVVGFDGSAGAQRALDAAGELIGYGSTLTVVCVSANRESAGPHALAEAHDRLLDRLVTATYLHRVGDAAEELVAVARELDADLVVVGRRGEEEQAAPGSVSADVVRRAASSVLVVG
jgi:nucleotide-binding universal stress UspA family protein